MKILIVEDDKNIAEGLKRELETWNYEVKIAEQLNDVVGEFKNAEPQLVLLDVMLPFNNGYFWCQEIRKISTVPIIFISSRSENMDIVMAMQFGGDDYITKPLDLNVTVAKIGAILRRSYDFAVEVGLLKFGEASLNASETKLINENSGESIDLTRTELMIAESLFKANGMVVSRDSIMERCWQGDSYIDDNTLAVNVTRLRKKIEKIGLSRLIGTKKGIGYYLDDKSNGEING